MLNTYLFKNNEIFIDAPGNADRNRIKNDLLWDINNFLNIQFDLYTFEVSMKPSNSLFCIPVSSFVKKYVEFHKLEDMFIQRTALSNDDVNHYRELMDPARKMSDDVFMEACCVENVDMEYVATSNLEHLSGVDIPEKCRSKKFLNSWLISLFPVYISLFASKEMQIVINQSDLLEPIKDIVLKHCMPKG